MKGLSKLLEIILGIFLTLRDIVAILALPALFAVIGWLNGYPWQYYALTIGGYFVIIAILQLILHLVFKKLEKKYTSALERLIQRLFPPKENTHE